MSRSLFQVLSIYLLYSSTSTSISIMMASWTTKLFHSIPTCTAFSTGTTTSVSTSTRRTVVTSTRRITGSSRSSRIRQRASSPILLPSWQLASTRTAGVAASRTYSQATKDRIQRLNAETEFANLSRKMKTTPSELQILLSQRMAAASIDATEDDRDSLVWTEKEEYLDWLLSGSSINNRKKTKTITTKKQNNRPMPPLTSRTSRTLQDLNSSNSSNRSRAFGTNVGSITTDTENDNKTQQTFHTEIRFDDPTTIQLDPLLLKGVAKMGLTQMTEIQSKTFVAASTGNDVLGRARTGTGKTVAFLLPALQRLINEGKVDDPNSVGMLIVSPTRELASQIGEQAKQLLQYHNGASVQVMFGGTNMKTDINRLSGTSRNKGSKSGLPTVLVATPGRLLDHLRSTKLRDPKSNNIISFGKDIMKRTCQILVLDETDRLLDMGFRNDIENIMQFLPPSGGRGGSVGRQTLLFSATIPQDLKVIMKKHMNAKYQEIDCVQDGDAATQTNASVQQTHLITPSQTDSVTAVIETIHYAVESHYDSVDGVVIPPKIVVFFPTARLVQFYAEIFHEVTGGVSVNVIDHNNDNEYNGGTNKNKKMKAVKLQSWELHSKKSQGYRNRVSEEFRQATTGVLFTSDVSARGVDYPNVSQVIQCGMPESRDQYIHRLGRTGRAGQKGTGWLLLQAWEAPFLRELQGVAIPVNTPLQARLQHRMNDSRESDINGTDPEESSNDATSMMVQELHRRVRGRDGILSKSAEQAYAAFLGYYKGQMKRMTLRNSEELVRTANDFATSSGFVQGPPALQKSTVSKMGLKGVPGLNISSQSHSSTGGRGGGRGGGRNGGGRGGSSGGGRGGGRGGRGRSEQSFDRGGGGRDSIGRRFRQGQDR